MEMGGNDGHTTAVALGVALTSVLSLSRCHCTDATPQHKVTEVSEGAVAMYQAGISYRYH